MPKNEFSTNIQIDKTPKGSAPWLIRRAWRGITVPARLATLDERELDPLRNFQLSPRRVAFVVDREAAIKALESAGRKKAASFFNKNWPQINFSFGADEAKLV